MTLSISNISHIPVNENIAYGEVSHHTINALRNDPGGFGMKENVASLWPLTCPGMSIS